MKAVVKFALLLSLFAQVACGQSKGLNGVYAGIQITPGVTMGGGMMRSDNVFLFRADGTFTDNLRKADWKTRVDGRYTVSGKTVTIKYSTGNNHTLEYKLDKDGDIDAGGYTLIHQPTDSSVPPGYYKFSNISGSGGGSSGSTYVGTSSDNSLNFDGKGNFSNNKASATAVIGANVGGGGGHQSSGTGTYKISKGTLTLNFSNGKTEVHSFFCRPGYKPVMAVIDGNIFFMEDGNGQSKRPVSSSKGSTSASAGTEGSASSANSSTADAKAMLLKANAVHGGKTLDNVKTVSFTATLQGLQTTSYVDVNGQRVRLEVRQNGKLLQVEQLEGQSGWRWQNGAVSTLPATRISEMGSVFYSGLLGLRRAEIEALTIKGVKQTNTGLGITATKNGKQLIFLLNDKGQLIASGDNAGAAPSSSVYSDFRNAGGLLVPFQETNTSGRQKMQISYQKFEINNNIPESVWNKP